MKYENTTSKTAPKFIVTIKNERGFQSGFIAAPSGYYRDAKTGDMKRDDYAASPEITDNFSEAHLFLTHRSAKIQANKIGQSARVVES